MQKSSVYILWIWWIWISAIARYYLHLWWDVYWSDKVETELTETLEKEWVIIPPPNHLLKPSPPVPLPEGLGSLINLVVYTEAVPSDNKELLLAKEKWIKTLTYPEALAEIVNSKRLISIAWTHWKSTTTSLTSLVLKDSEVWVNTVVWTLLKEFWNKNTYFSDSENFVIEACEYKRSFLKYKPSVAVITNIELDHLDYYKDLEDYLSAYEEYINNIVTWWYAILNWEDENCLKLDWKRNDINYIKIFSDYFIFWEEKIIFPEINMQVPWDHILFDAKIAYIVWHMFWLNDNEIITKLENYSWVWRRNEIIWKTENGNILMSDYGHHPTEIKLTLEAIKTSLMEKPSPSLSQRERDIRKLFVIFQPHQYNRTLELLEDFKDCFSSADKLIIPDIYESRDSKEDKQKINSKIL